MQNLKNKYGNRALVTGATSGIGKAFAFELAKQGIEPILVARNQQRLDDRAKEISSKFNVKTQTFSVDLSIEEAVKVFVHAAFSDKHVLI